MRQSLSRFFRTGGLAAGSKRAMFFGTSTVAATWFMYKQTQQMPFFGKSTFALCAPAHYKVPSQAKIDAARKDLMDFIGSRRNIAPLMVRLSWHDAGTYDEKSNTGGPRGCMRFA